MDVQPSPADTDWLYAVTHTAGFYVSSNGGDIWHQGPEGAHHIKQVFPSTHDPEVAYTVKPRRTTNGGRTLFGPHSDFEDLRLPKKWRQVAQIEWDPFDPETLYADSWTGTVYRSRNGGRDWTKLEIPGLDSGLTRRVAAHPNREGELMVASPWAGVYRSLDRGDTWTHVSGTSSLPGVAVGLEYAGPESEEGYVIIKSKGDGANGVHRFGSGDRITITEDLPNPDFIQQSNQVTADGNFLYFVAAHDSKWDETSQHLYRYDRGSDNLEQLDTPEPPVSVTAHPWEPSTIFLGGMSWVYRSPDGGQTWDKLADGFVEHYLATVGVNPDQPGTVVPGTICQGGLFTSHDRGMTYDWERSGLRPFHDEHPFAEHYVMRIAAAQSTIYATTSAGLLISEDNGDSWRLLDTAFSGQGSLQTAHTHLHGLATRPNDPDIVYVGTGLGGAGAGDAWESPHIWKSTDGANTWREITPEFPSNTDTVVKDIIVSSDDPSVVYAGTNAIDHSRTHHGQTTGTGLGLYKSTTAGEQWSNLTTPFSDVEVITQDAGSPDRIYASTQSGIYCSNDGGESWRSVLSSETKGLLAHPSEPGTVIAGVHTSDEYWDVLITQDGGQTWVDGNLTLQVGLEPNTRPHHAAERYSESRLDAGDIMEFAFDERNSDLYAATRGTGLWRADASLFSE